MPSSPKPGLPFQKRPGLFLLLVLLALPALPVRAQPAEAVRHFDEGNRRYVQGDYRGALAAYGDAVTSGYASGALYYNMGNAYYRLDRLGQAIRYYEKARRLLPDRIELRHNLEIARARTTDQFSQLPEPFWRVWWRALLTRVGPGALLAAGLAFYLAAAVLFGHRLWTGTRSAWHRRALAACAVAGVCLLTLAFAASLDPRLDRRAVVTAAETGLHEAPQDGASVALDVHEGLLLDVLQERETWLEVRLPNGATGWIAAGAVAEI